MRRREFITALGGAAAWPLVARAQRTGKEARVGYLGTSSPSLERQLVNAFRERLRELGHVEGENIAIEYRWAEGRDDRLPGLAAELVRLKPDVIVTMGTPGTLAAAEVRKAEDLKNAFSTIASERPKRCSCWRIASCRLIACKL